MPEDDSMSETPETGQEVRGGCIERPTEGAMNCAGVRFVGVAFTDLADVASWLSFSGCEFIDCDFSRADLRHARLCGPVLKPGTGSRFHGCRFDAADIRDVYLVGADFENCSFKDVDLHGVHFKRNNLIGNRFAGIVDGLTIWGQEPESPKCLCTSVPVRTGSSVTTSATPIFAAWDSARAFPSMTSSGRARATSSSSAESRSAL